jgi:hypothetical protein
VEVGDKISEGGEWVERMKVQMERLQLQEGQAEAVKLKL